MTATAGGNDDDDDDGDDDDNGNKIKADSNVDNLRNVKLFLLMRYLIFLLITSIVEEPYNSLNFIHC